MQLNLREAARLLHVEEDQIQRWINGSGLPATRINEQYRINRVQLLEWATSSGLVLSPKIFRDSVGHDDAPPSLGAALVAGGIFHDVRGAEPAEVLRSVVRSLHLPPTQDREFLVEMLLAREGLGSTGVGDGIAIPHVRNPIVLHVPEASVNLSFLQTPVDFRAMDGKPVHCLFTLVSPTVKTHLHLLSRLAYALRDADLRRLLGARSPADTILERVKAIDIRLNDSQTAVTRKVGL